MYSLPSLVVFSLAILSGANAACNTPLEFSMAPLTRIYNSATGQHRFQADGYVLDTSKGSGWSRVEGSIGSVVDGDLYQGNTDTINKECPSLVKLRVVYNPSNNAQRITTESWRIQQYLSQGWVEGKSAGYCSTSQACGTNKNLRGVYAHDGGNNVFSTDDYELSVLNTQNPRYRGTLSPTICWLF